ncbi:MAG TPA: glycosyltransferase family 4 protein [Flavisolibacter sp.]|jgi:glycosyltransferase involved in cell wall biosynthesis|nr:glycosyltransferase family 4 protein [Flavisolibacter sp.]
MHIALVSYEYPPVNAVGGIGSYMEHLANFLWGNGHKVTVFSADPSGSDVKETILKYCVNYLIPAKDNESFREAVVPVFDRFLRSNFVDAIESPEVGACAWYIKEKYPHIPLIVKMHTPGVLITKFSNTYIPALDKLRFVAGALRRGKIDLGYWSRYDKNRDVDLEYKICRRADILLSPSVALQRWASHYWKIPAEEIKILPNPFSLDEELFKLPLEQRPQVICFIGKLSVLKGMRTLTEAIPFIVKKNRNCKIFLVGRDVKENGQSMKEYMQVKLKKYHKNIVFTGALERNELAKIYAISKINVVPSLWENYPTVVLESMAAGVAVIASDAGGIPEMITDSETGYLINSKSSLQLAKTINIVLKDENERLRIVKAAREKLQKSINSQNFKEDQLNIYCSVGRGKKSFV